MQTQSSALHAAVDEAELAQLEQRWGHVSRLHYRQEVDDPFLTGDHQQLVSDGRRAEICYIMHRGVPADGLLLHIKTFYPSGAYRLPTGGIHCGERVWETLAREIREETGLFVGEEADQVRVQRFLGVVSYELAHRRLGASYSFATYHFLVQMPYNAELHPQDASEQIGGWRWSPLAELPQVSDVLANVGAQSSVWADWGRFRALSHHFVADALAAPLR
jgi:8-oxo-dGTP pyrophosphatase MutT (NUDIX family)